MQSLLRITTLDLGTGKGAGVIQRAESESAIIGALVLLLCYILQDFKIQSDLKYLTMPGIENSILSTQLPEACTDLRKRNYVILVILLVLVLYLLLLSVCCHLLRSSSLLQWTCDTFVGAQLYLLLLPSIVSDRD
jgi:hypothetical protein